MRFTLLLMRQSSKLWGATSAMSTIHLLQVSISQAAFCIIAVGLKSSLATSGACATIASDALMTPFDGESSYLKVPCAI